MTTNYKEETLKLLRAIYRDGMEDLIAYLENDTDFFTAPASTKYHSNFIGGLVEHSYKVTKLFWEKCKAFKVDVPWESVALCGLMHDLCKCNFYIRGIKNVKEGKKPDGRDNWVEKEVWDIDDKLPLGHGSKSVILLQRFIKLTDFETMAILYHMGLPEEYSAKMSYGKALEQFPAIILLHTADEESSYLLEKTLK